MAVMYSFDTRLLLYPWGLQWQMQDVVFCVPQVCRRIPVSVPCPCDVSYFHHLPISSPGLCCSVISSIQCQVSLDISSPPGVPLSDLDSSHWGSVVPSFPFYKSFLRRNEKLLESRSHLPPACPLNRPQYLARCATDGEFVWFTFKNPGVMKLSP